jgi:TonB family protein
VNTGMKKLMGAVMVFAAAQFALADAEKHLSAPDSLAAAISKPQPEYPVIARQLKLEGTVNLQAHVTEEGAVDHVETISGNPILSRSAEDALKRWKFNKQTEDGKPVKFVATVTFNFKQ